MKKTKKLSVRLETLRELSTPDLARVAGGATQVTLCRCPPSQVPGCQPTQAQGCYTGVCTTTAQWC